MRVLTRIQNAEIYDIVFYLVVLYPIVLVVVVGLEAGGGAGG